MFLIIKMQIILSYYLYLINRFIIDETSNWSSFTQNNLIVIYFDYSFN